MADLASIAPATKTAALGRSAVEVAGLSLRKLTQLVATYPDLIGFVAGGKLDVVTLLASGPEMALAIFALGFIGPARPRWWQRFHPRIEEDDWLKAFDRAPAGQQLDVLGAIVDLTFRSERGGPFLKSLAGGLQRPDQAPSESATSEPSMPASSSD